MKKLYALCLTLIICSCAPRVIYPTVSNYVGSADFARYKKITVLPFSDAPDSPESGQIVRDLAEQAFTQYGFDVLERARLEDILREQTFYLPGAINASQTIRIGKQLGVKAIVSGQVNKYSRQQREKTDMAFIPWTDFYTGRTTYIPRQGPQRNESVISLSLQVLDVESGSIIYSGSGQFDSGVSNPPQQVAEYLLDVIAGTWIVSPGIIGVQYARGFDGVSIIKINRGSPAEKAGLQAGDKIIKINGMNSNNHKPRLELVGLLWGKPGEKVVLEVQRNNEFKTFEATRVPREKVHE